MKELLFLAHRLPYPPDKGDKIRSYHMLKHLAQTYRVHVGTFVDNSADWRHADAVERLCGGEVYLAALRPWQARVRSLAGLFTGQALSFPYYFDAALRAWLIALLCRRPIETVVVFSSSMGQYLWKTGAESRRRIIDFVDIDSDKWRQYSVTKPWPWRGIYAREARRLAAAENRLVQECELSLLVCAHEARLLQERLPHLSQRISWANNGVDSDYFSPERDYPNPYPKDIQAIVFTGAMDYWANVDAVDWFAHQVMPELHACNTQCVFYIVGAQPTRAVRRLAQLPGIIVTGAVPDVRPYLAHARLAVAPLRIARGVQNKVLEALAMACPLLATPAAVAGIDAEIAARVTTRNQADEWISYIGQTLDDASARIKAQALRPQVVEHYRWERGLRHLNDMVEGRTAACLG